MDVEGSASSPSVRETRNLTCSLGGTAGAEGPATIAEGTRDTISFGTEEVWTGERPSQVRQRSGASR